MQAGGAVKNGGRPVARIVVQEWAAALQLVFEVRKLAATRAAVFVILSANRQTDAIAGRNDDRCRVLPSRLSSAPAFDHAYDRGGKPSTIFCRAYGARHATTLARQACVGRWRPGRRFL